MTNRFKRALAIALCSSSLTLVTVPSAASAAPRAEDNRCTPIRFVYVKGTFSSKTGDSTHPDRMHEGKDLYNAMVRAVGPQNVSGYSVSYPASVGAISPFLVAGMDINGWGGGNEAVTFGDSVKTAVRNGTEHISEYKRACPNTKFVIGGYSQGASAAGTIASEIASGKVPGVNSNDVAGVLLYADPYRSATSEFDSYSGEPASTLYANPMPGVMGRNLETIVGYAPSGRDDFVGWAGPRSQNFAGMQGKVMSLCHDLDPACSVPANGMLRIIADYVDKENSYPIIKDVKTFQKLQKFVQQATQSGAIDKIMKADPSAGDDIAKAFFAAGFTPDDLITLIFAIKEVAELTSKMYKDAGIQHAATYEEFLLMLLLTALPSVVQSGTSHDTLIRLLNNPALTNALAGMGPQAVAAQQGAIATLQALKTYDIAMVKANEMSSKAGLPQLPAMSSRVALGGSSFVAGILPEVRISGSSLVDDGSSIGSSKQLSSEGLSSIGSSSSSSSWIRNRGSSNGGGSSDMGIGIGGSSIGNVNREDTVVLSSNYKENIDKAKARAEKGDYITTAEILGINFGSAVNDISLLLAQSLGLLKKMRGPEFQSVLDEARTIGQFGYHASYWDTRFKANGMSGGQAAEAWVSEIATNVMANRSWKYQANGKATSTIEPDIEKVIEPYSMRYLKEHPAITKAEYNATQPGYVFIVDKVQTGTRGLIRKKPVFKEMIVAAYPKSDPMYKEYINKAVKDPDGNFGIYRTSGSWNSSRFEWGKTPIGLADLNGTIIFGSARYSMSSSPNFKQTNSYRHKMDAVDAYNKYVSERNARETTILPASHEDFYKGKDNVLYKQKDEVTSKPYAEFKMPDFSNVSVDVPAEAVVPQPVKPEEKPPTPAPAPTTEMKKTTTPVPQQPTTTAMQPSTGDKTTTTPAPQQQPTSTTAVQPPAGNKQTTAQQPTVSQPPAVNTQTTQAPAPQNQLRVENFPARDKSNSTLVTSNKNPNQVAANIPSTSKKTNINLDTVLKDNETVKDVKVSDNNWKVNKVKDNVYEVEAPKNNTSGIFTFTVEGSEGAREIKVEALTPEFNVDAFKWTVSEKKDGSTVVKGPGNFNGRFKFSKYSDPVVKVAVKPASAETKYAGEIDKITINPDTGDITVPDSVPNGAYVVPVQVTDTETGKDAVINVTAIKDDNGVKIEQDDMVSNTETSVTTTSPQRPSAAVETTPPANEETPQPSNTETAPPAENPGSENSQNTPVAETPQTEPETGTNESNQGTPPGQENPAPGTVEPAPAEVTDPVQPENNPNRVIHAPDSENKDSAGTGGDTAVVGNIDEPSREGENPESSNGVEGENNETADVNNVPSVNDNAPVSPQPHTGSQVNGTLQVPDSSSESTNQGGAQSTNQTTSRGTVSTQAGEETTSVVRKVLASTGASVGILAVLSLLMAGLGVAVALRRKEEKND